MEGETQKHRVVSGRDAIDLLPDQVVDAAMSALAEETYELKRLRLGCSESRMKLRELLEGPAISLRRKGASYLLGKVLLNVLYPKWTRQHECEDYVAQGRQLRDEGKFSVVPDDSGEKAAAMCAWKYVGRMPPPDGRQILMITKAFTFPEHRREGMFDATARGVQAHIEEEVGEGKYVILCISREEHVLKHLRTLGYEEVSLSDALLRWRDPATVRLPFNDQMVKEMEQSGWQAILFDPQKQAQPVDSQ